MMIRGPVPVFVRSRDAEFQSVDCNFTGSGHCAQINELFEHGDGEGTTLDWNDGESLKSKGSEDV